MRGRIRLFRERVEEFWLLYKRDSAGIAGLILLAIIISMAILAPYLPIPDPYSIEYDRFLPPSYQHLFGTDHLGRDVLSRIVWGARTSIIVGIIAAGISAVIGVFLGALAGYMSGLVDDLLSRIIDVFLMIPAFFLILVIVAVFGSNLIYVMIVIGLVIWPTNARIMRAQALSIRERLFVEAARAVGASTPRILLRHVIPNGVQPVIANSILQMAQAIIIEAALSFIGLGDPNIVSWGKMIYEGMPYLTTYWWIPVAPGMAIVITVFAINLVGDALGRIMTPEVSRRM